MNSDTCKGCGHLFPACTCDTKCHNIIYSTQGCYSCWSCTKCRITGCTNNGGRSPPPSNASCPGKPVVNITGKTTYIEYPRLSGDYRFLTTGKFTTQEPKRRYLPTLSELIDRLSILQIKEVKIPENKEEYAKEIKDICHDIDLILSENNMTGITSKFIREIIILGQYNLHIWINEANCRKGIKDGNNLELTHGLNSIRNTCKNKIQELIGGRVDLKLDNAEPFKEWIPSW